MRKWKARLKQFANFILIWLVELLKAEGEELNGQRVEVIKKICKQYKFFKEDEPELRETLKETFGISNYQSILIWGETEHVSKEVFQSSIKVLAEIIPYNVIKNFFILIKKQ